MTATVRPRRVLLAVADHAVLVTVSAVFLAPIAFIVLTALMTDQQALTGELWPAPFAPGNLGAVFDRLPLLRYARNSLVIASAAAVGAVVTGVPAAYALARLRWRGRDAMLVVVLASAMLPVQALVLPLYVLFAKIHWTGSLLSLAVPRLFGDAFAIFLLRQFFLTIPEELLEAARAEGASEWQVMTRVVAPLARPAVAAVAVFAFFTSWNDLFLPLVLVGENQDAWPLALSLSEFRGRHEVEWNLTLAASSLYMVPVVALFAFAQRAVLQGVTVTGSARRS